jgi:hypothetical protein
MLHFLGSLAAPWRVKWHGTTNKEPAMLKKLALAAAALMLAAPALADHGHRNQHRGHGHRHVVVHQPHYVVHHRPVVVHRPAVVHHVYRPAPRPVYVVEQHYAPVNPVAVLAGAVIGGAIVHHVLTGH